MREFIDLLEASSDTITLYRGDSSKIDRFEFAKTDPEALLGIGIYLTNDAKVAQDYTVKGRGDSGVVFRPREPVHDVKDLVAQYLRSILDGEVEGGGIEETLRFLKHEWEEKYREATAHLDWTDKEGRGAIQQTITAQYGAARSALIKKEVAKAKAEFAKQRPDMRVVKQTTGEYIFVKNGRAGQIATFEVPVSYAAKCLNVEAPLSDELLAVAKAAFTRSSRENDSDQQWDLRHWDEKGHEAVAKNFDQFIDGYKKMGARYAWTDSNYGEKGENPSLDFLWNGTHSGYHVFQNNREKQQALIDDLMKLGYVGYFYNGGVRLAGTLARGGGGHEHEAFVFWDDEKINSFRKDDIGFTDDEIGDVDRGMRADKVIKAPRDRYAKR